MRALGLALLIAGLPALTAAADEPPKGWVTFRSLPGRFALLAPTDKPKVAIEQTDTGVGKVDLPTATWELGEAGSELLLIASYGDVLPKAVQKPDARQREEQARRIIDGARDGMTGNGKGKLISEKRLAVGTYPGLDLVIEPLFGANGPKPGTYLMRVKLLLVGERLYQVMLLGTKAQVESKEALAFLASFRLI